MNHITIIGSGLIGGSFAALVKFLQPQTQITCIDVCKTSCDTALNRGWADAIQHDLLALGPTDLIILATPISVTRRIMDQLTQGYKESQKIMEFTSVKAWINDIKTHHAIISAHPMGGLDDSGIEFANHDILYQKPMILIQEYSENILAWCQELAFSCIDCPDIQTHDAWMADVSHGPYLAACLMPKILSKRKNLRQLSQITAGGFRDTTRVSNSPIDWGQDILLQNKDKMRDCIDDMIVALEELKTGLDDADQVSQWLQEAKETRRVLWNPSSLKTP